MLPSTAQTIALVLGLFEFCNAYNMLFAQQRNLTSIGTVMPEQYFHITAFRRLFVATIMFLGTQRLTFAFSPVLPSSGKGRMFDFFTPWFSNVICHVVECWLWYTSSMSYSGKTATETFVLAATFAGDDLKCNIEDFMLLVLLPLLTVYFYIAGATEA
jgi:hypothetical protein